MQISQLQQRLDQNPSDYEAIQGLGIVYHLYALKDSKAYTKKAVQCHVVICYLGSAYTTLAKDASDPEEIYFQDIGGLPEADADGGSVDFGVFCVGDEYAEGLDGLTFIIRGEGICHDSR